MTLTAVSPEDKFGIRIQPRRTRAFEQHVSAVLGSIYFVGGAIGFIATGAGPITGFAPHHALFGFFPLNVYHNIVHLVIGALWFLGAYALTAAGNEGLNIAIGGIYALATAIGFLGYLPLLNIHPGNDVDNYLHLITAVVTLIFGTGLISAMRRRQAAAPA